MGAYVEYSLQNRFVFFISHFGLSFENSQQRACALRGVSGRVHLEPKKKNVRRAEERVW